MEIFFDVVPVQVQANIALAAPVGGDLVVGPDDSEEMFDMLYADIFHIGIFNAKCKGDGAPSVRPETWGECILACACLLLQ